jgi:hypothetical protein
LAKTYSKMMYAATGIFTTSEQAHAHAGKPLISNFRSNAHAGAALMAWSTRLKLVAAAATNDWSKPSAHTG